MTLPAHWVSSPVVNVIRVLLVGCDPVWRSILKAKHVSTHFIYGYMASDIWQKTTPKERNVLFNDSLNTFYLRLYGVGHMAKDHSEGRKCFNDSLNRKDHSDNERKPAAAILSSRVILYAPSHRQHKQTTTFVTPFVEHWLEREIAHWVHHEGSIRRSIAPWALPRSYISLLFHTCKCQLGLTRTYRAICYSTH